MSRIAKLPAGYRQVEHIESSGTQYVDTGVMPNGNTGVDMVATPTSSTAAVHTFFGARANRIFYAMLCAEGNYNKIYYQYNSVYSNTFAVSDAAEWLKQKTISTRAGTATVDGVQKSYTNVTYQMQHNLYLMASNEAGTPRYMTSMKLYSCQIYDNGTLIRDYVPCINPSGEAGLYDLVYGVFYGNAGTSVFAVGRNVYSEDEITKLEYVESTGEQYIDTGFAPNHNSRAVVEVQFRSHPTYYAAIFGANDSTNEWWIHYRYNQNRYCAVNGGSAQYYIDYAALTERHTIDLQKGLCCVNNNEIVLPEKEFSVNTTLCLFTLNNKGGKTTFPTSCKLYFCQIYDNGTLVRDYYPATADGEVGLWDACSGVLYASASGTALIAGPELITIEPPKNLAAFITEAGVVLTWDAEEKAIGYKVYRDETNLAYTAETSYTDGTAKANNNYIYGVSAYDADTETAATEITVFVETPYSPLELITDRTREALERVIELAGKDYVTEMSAEEQEEWRNGMKGAYNASDLNRVEKAVDALAKQLRELLPELKSYAAKNKIGWDAFYAPPFDPSQMYPSTKRDWTMRDIPAPADMERYLSNIKLLRNALVYNTDALPATMENLTWSGANAIEKALFALDSAIILFSADVRLMIDKAVAARFYSNEIYSGEV